MRNLKILGVCLFGLLLCFSSTAQAALVDAGPGAFTPLATVITFGEPTVPLGTTNPVYNFPSVPILGNVTVSFGGHFVGQAASGGFPNTLSDSTPTPGVALALDPLAPVTRTVNDSAPGATSPVLSGGPSIFNGPISVLFNTPVAGVGLKGGFFDAVNSTTIEAYDPLGNVLGAITNSVTGFEFYGLVDSSGKNVISGISFFITGSEPAGFEIDNLTFGAVGGGVVVPTPVPGTLLLLGSALAGLGLMRKKLF